MSTPECNGFNKELPDQTQLEDLFYKTSHWFENNSAPTIEGVVDGLHNGLPVIDDAPHYDFETNGEKVLAFAPATRGFIAASDRIKLSYLAEHYEHDANNPHDLSYFAPICVFLIEKRQLPEYSVAFSLSGNEDETTLPAWRVYKAIEYKPETVSVIEQSIAELPLLDMDILRSTEQSLNYMTQEEYDFLWSLVDALGIIKYRSEPPLYVPSWTSE